jgi:hypothetical protein
MTSLHSRRGILRCLTGLIAAPAIVRADALMRVVAPRTATALITLDEYDRRSLVPLIEGMVEVWETTLLYGTADFEPISFQGFGALLPDQRPEGGVATRQLRLG